MVNKKLLEIRLCNLATYVFKRHVKIVKTYMVKINVPILNMFEIMIVL